MGETLYISTAGALARMRELDVVANNLANVDTAGFKRDRTLFDVALQAALQRVDGSSVSGVSGQVYVGTRASQTEHSAGPIAQTGSPLDVAIDGPGFFEIETPEGPRYTRAGSFVVSQAGVLGTPDGFPVLSDGGALTVGSIPIEINDQGEVVDATGGVLGRLRVVMFEDPSQLLKAGRNLFAAPEGVAASERPDPSFLAHSVERSNTEPVRELANLIALQRLFDTTMQVIRSEDESTGRLLQEVSR